MNKFRSNRGGSHRPSMHRATCAECGNSCEVPFRPTGEKPVYCSDCFGSKGGGDSRGGSGGRRDDRGRGDNRSYGNDRFNRRDSDRRDSGRPSMHSAVCASCGDDCEVPFRPREDKPVYCSDCFGENKGGRDNRNQGGGGKREKSHGQRNEQHDIINAKLDRILGLLDPNFKKDSSPKKEKGKQEKKAKPAKTPAKSPAKAAPKKSKPKKAAKKAVVKKVAAKKPAKKAPAKKKPAAKKPSKKATKKPAKKTTAKKKK